MGASAVTLQPNTSVKIEIIDSLNEDKAIVENYNPHTAFFFLRIWTGTFNNIFFNVFDNTLFISVASLAKMTNETHSNYRMC